LVVLSSGGATNTETSLSRAAQSLTDKDVEIWAVHGGTDSSSYLSEIVPQSSQLLSSLSEGDPEDFQKNFVMSVCHCKYNGYTLIIHLY
jgi:ABC-type branched-subunit amino acid transport system substrate-binding protein